MRRLKFAALLLALGCVPLIASADVLLLKDGRAITGKLQGADQYTVTFQANGGQVRRYQISDVTSVTFTTPGGSPVSDGSVPDGRPTIRRRPADDLSPSPEADSVNDPYGNNRGGSVSDSRPTLQRREPASTAPATTASAAPPPPPRSLSGITVHAGTVITVRMVDPVDSSVDQMGQTFRATLDEPLIVDGQTVAARGADVTAKLVSKTEAGRVTGRSELDLVLMDIMLDGRRYEVSTSEVTQSGSSRGKQSAERVGVGTALGAVIGAIAGGGKGAAIGAATGAGAGTAVQVMTHGEAVKIPTETRLDFTLAQPLNL